MLCRSQTGICSVLLKLQNNFKNACYSNYAPYFVDPVYKKHDLEELTESGEADKLKHVPIKAAKNEHTSSVYHDTLTRKLINYVLRKGKKDLARDLIEKTYENMKRIQLQKINGPEGDKLSIETNPVVILEKAVENCKPLLQLSPIKRGGVVYQVPVPISAKRSEFLAFKWLVLAGKEKERTIHFPEKMAWELIDASENKGKVVKKKQDLHRQCEANRAYAHYRWS
ncbi:28S ribosomal protein S7, mitochondrial [Ischnura elegans]|uniref:28S ribosomal protein S7, mitochondrial n=1 Tax=Ischnura elegans TaxID=197161 RepID=UPI001ED8713F|nr:28S ribosomal protein S7, mitochondrial [Ischnura elegans]